MLGLRAYARIPGLRINLSKPEIFLFNFEKKITLAKVDLEFAGILLLQAL